MTIRDLYNLTAAARGHWVICGTTKTIADTLEWRKMATETIPRMKEMRAGLTPEIEARVLEAYAAAKAGSGKSGG